MFIRTMLFLCLIGAGTSAVHAQQEAPSTASKAEITDNAVTPAVHTNELSAKSLTVGADLDTDTTVSVNEAPFDQHDLSPIGMYKAADVVVKSVIIGLLLASLVSWAICIFKSVQLNIAKRNAKKLLKHLIQSESFAKANHTLLLQQSEALTLLKATQHELQLTGEGLTTDEGLKERLIARLERVQAALSANMNQGTGILATIGSVAPFVGLFGTVWGIMNSFIGIAKTQTTNLAVVAPGIAEALLATALGLVAAIPAVIMYNHFSRVIGSYKAQLADILTAIMILVSRDLDRKHPDAKHIAYLLNDKDAADAVSKEL
ncbi:MAG: tonB-system energizer ExbB [Pseudoalteromonas prydzensis]|uniref:tonB-system energizer ExbB n=1 Tax=Pseudoalteromonas prydzensis TaxID=182141 RepID=UPI003F99E71B